MDKFKNLYRIPSARAQWWDYSNNAAYFITICTHEHVNYFWNTDIQSEIKKDHNNETNHILSKIGQIVHKNWNEITNHFEDVNLGEFIVMPNHVHGIILLERTSKNFNQTKLHSTGGITGKNNPMLNMSISKIIRWFKAGSTFEIHKFHNNFLWQSRFHDHIIRDEKEYSKISEYIINNPENWENDKFFSL